MGELRSLDPCESFVRFFLRKPNEGMGAAVGWGGRIDVLSTAATAKSTSGGSAAVEHSTRCLARSGEANNARHALPGSAASATDAVGSKRTELQLGDRCLDDDGAGVETAG